jgi:multidrug efflux pump subunit AcrB
VFDWLSGFHRWFNDRFEKFREGYRDLLNLGLRNAGKLVTLVLGFAAISTLLYPFLGQNFFPSVDTGQFEMHVRMRAGTRIEETARTVDQIEEMMRQIIPANQVEMIVDNIGIADSGINLSYNTTGTMSAADCDVLVSLKENHDPTNRFVEAIRARMHHDFTDVGVWFPPADIVSQTLSGSEQTAQNFWVDPRNRVSYQINAQAPQYDLHSLDDLRNLPILGASSGQAQILANVASISRTTTSPVEDHYNIRPVINIYGGAVRRD